MTQKTITIKGIVYDAHSGERIGSAIEGGKRPSVAARSSQTMHQMTQKSHTLNRRVVAGTAKQSIKKVSHPARQSIERSPSITRFAPHTANALHLPQQRIVSDVAPTVHHPIAAKLQQDKQVQPSMEVIGQPKPSHVIKQEAITKALNDAPKHSAQSKQVTQPRRLQRIGSIGSIAIALLLLGGYFAYINMPGLSVRVAAVEAGINATYPSYRPDGYTLAGSVAYNQNEVDMKFASNSGSQNFTLDQQKTDWDSTAVLENYVKQKAGDNYITYNENGLTIYTYDSNAAWVNNGILYTINGDAPLTSDQIRHIAISM